MGCVENITYDKFPKQADNNYEYPQVGKRVKVYYHYDTSKHHYGEIIRCDIEEPFETIIKLDNGRYIRATECQYQEVKENKLTNNIVLHSPCSPCLCPGASCEQCMFSYKSTEEAMILLKSVLDNNTYPGIVERYNLYHKKYYKGE